MKKKREMINKEIRKNYLAILLLTGIVLLTLIFSINHVSAQQTFWCAERTTSGAWCQNVPQSEIDTRYRSSPSSCESTAFCKKGTCVNGVEGTCLPNTPQVVCQQNSGVWVQEDISEVQQCQLGCCYIGDGASFVTQTRCSRLSGIYGVETNFDGSIKDQTQCLLSAFPKEKGACVMDDGFSRGCKFTTREECQDLQSTAGTSGNQTIEFHGGFLCTATSLGTICGQTTNTKLEENDDAVYFRDSCGNRANIYDASKVNDQEYWTNVIERKDSCVLNYDSNGNPTNSESCGNCNYFEGSTGKLFQRGNSQTPTQPRHGDYVCAALNCRWQGQSYKHGESWCANTATSQYENLPGSESMKLVCYSGEVTVETPDPFRQTTCTQTTVNEFRVASFRANKWQDCVLQNNVRDCTNTEKRDCKWIISRLYAVLYGQGNMSDDGLCVPRVAPGFDFYNEGTEAQQLCATFNANCVVKYEKGPFGAWECVENCECQVTGAADARGRDFENLCIALGDCGASTNYIGVQGWNTESFVFSGNPE